MTASYTLQFDSKPYGFRIVGDDNNKNAIVKAILNPLLAKSLYVGSWLTQINDIVVESWEFSKIIGVLRDADLPVLIQFRQCLILYGTDDQLLAHSLSAALAIEVSDTGKEPSQQKQGKPFVAYNLLVSDSSLSKGQSTKMPLKWQLWKRYNQFETLHKQLVRLVPDLAARLPPKQHFGRFKPGFIRARRLQLQQYMDAVIAAPGVRLSAELRAFLIPQSFSQSLESAKQGYTYKDPSEMKPLLLEIRDRIETLCDSIELNNIDRDATLSAVRYILSLSSDICERTKDPMDATTVSRSFVTGLPNNNAFLKAADEIFFAKYLVDANDVDGQSAGDGQFNADLHFSGASDVLDWGLLLIDADDFTSLVSQLERQCGDPELGNNLLRDLSQSIYSVITHEHQKVFHLDADQFAVIAPIDGTLRYKE